MKRNVFLVLIGLVLGITETGIGWLLAPENLLGYLLIFAGLGYCIGGCIFLAVTRSPAGNEQQNEMAGRSDRTLLMLVPGALLILLAAPLEYALLPAALPRTPVMQWSGLGIILIGFALRIWVRRSLKGAYQGNLQVLPQQSLVTSGPYCWIRHPGYLGFILMAVGLAIGFSSLVGLLGAILLMAGFLFRCQVEERMLIQSFGEQYITYVKSTGQMLPRIHTISRSLHIGGKIK